MALSPPNSLPLACIWLRREIIHRRYPSHSLQRHDIWIWSSGGRRASSSIFDLMRFIGLVELISVLSLYPSSSNFPRNIVPLQSMDLVVLQGLGVWRWRSVVVVKLRRRKIRIVCFKSSPHFEVRSWSMDWRCYVRPDILAYTVSSVGLRHMLVDLVAWEDLSAPPAEMDTTATFDVIAAFGLLDEHLAARALSPSLFLRCSTELYDALPADVAALASMASCSACGASGTITSNA